MRKNKLSNVVFASLTVAGLLCLTQIATAAVNSETRTAAQRAGAGEVVEISFSKESSDLSDRAKAKLHKAFTKASKAGQIAEVRVAAWSDQEYPPQGVALAGTQVDLAEQRGDKVQTYLKQSLKVSDVSTLNMAKRPNEIQKSLNTSGAQAKNNLENSGAAPTTAEQTGLFGLKGKSSEVVVMIFYKK